ncbi:MAG: hypothetical protein ABGW81_00075 [Paracoccaceae bacterium]
MCLGNILDEVSVNGKLSPLNSLNFELLDAALRVFTDISDALATSPLGKEMRQHPKSEQLRLGFLVCAYKDEAGKQNSSLAADENGLSLIDIMGDEPLRNAYRDKIGPRSLGRDFAKEFDPLKMGVS